MSLLVLARVLDRLLRLFLRLLVLLDVLLVTALSALELRLVLEMPPPALTTDVITVISEMTVVVRTG